MTSKSNQAPNYLPANLRTLRKMCCLSQEDLASHLGLNRGNIASYENGSAEPKLCNLMKIASFFNLTMGDLTIEKITCKDHYDQLSNRLTKNNPAEKAFLNQVEAEIETYSKLIDSSTTCFRHFAEQAQKDNEELHAHYLFYYDQMHKITLDLLNKYKNLMEICKHKSN